MFLRFIQVAIYTSPIFIAEWNSIAWLYHYLLFILLLINIWVICSLDRSLLFLSSVRHNLHKHVLTPVFLTSVIITLFLTGSLSIFHQLMLFFFSSIFKDDVSLKSIHFLFPNSITCALATLCWGHPFSHEGTTTYTVPYVLSMSGFLQHLPALGPISWYSETRLVPFHGMP